VGIDWHSSGIRAANAASVAVQNGFDLCLHGFFVADAGHWTAISMDDKDALFDHE
jgi:hypothetical protein